MIMMIHALAYSLAFSGALPGPHEAGLLGDLPRFKEFTAGRHSSYDRTGGNMDGGQDEPIQPGETRTIAEMKRDGYFYRVTNAGVREAHPHDVKIIKEAPNYRS